jgi:hypothetical protein
MEEDQKSLVAGSEAGFRSKHHFEVANLEEVLFTSGEDNLRKK